MIFMPNRHNLDCPFSFNRIEYSIPIKPEFPWGKGIGPEWLFPSSSNFSVGLQVSDDPGDNEPLLSSIEISNVILCALCQ